MKITSVSLIVSMLFLNHNVMALDAGDLDELLGYTMIDYSNVSNDFEGADFDKTVKLDNGMIFEFTEYSYTYSYRPDVAVFAREFTTKDAAEMRKKGFKNIPKPPLMFYKLVVDDDIYDVLRIR
jgi:hypothetical protein